MLKCYRAYVAMGLRRVFLTKYAVAIAFAIVTSVIAVAVKLPLMIIPITLRAYILPYTAMRYNMTDDNGNALDLSDCPYKFHDYMMDYDIVIMWMGELFYKNRAVGKIVFFVCFVLGSIGALLNSMTWAYPFLNVNLFISGGCLLITILEQVVAKIDEHF